MLVLMLYVDLEKNLNKLMLNKCSHLRGALLDNLSISLVNLRTLGLAYWPNIYSKNIETLRRFHFLEYLDLTGCLHIITLTEIIPTFSSLKTLILADVPDIDDNLLLTVIKYCPKFSNLNINYSGPISLIVLMDIPQTFPKMEHLCLAAQPCVDDTVVEEIAKYCTSLITLDLSYTGVSCIKTPFNHLENLFLNGCSNIQSTQIVENIKAVCSKLTTLQVLNTTQLDIIKEDDDMFEDEVEV